MVETLKIGMLSWESLHSIKVGGLAQAVTGMSEGLAENSHEVHVFTRADTDQSEYEEVDGVCYHRCKFDHGEGILDHSEKMCKSLVEYLKREERKHGRFDVIHGHDWMVVDALERLKEHPTIMSFHSTEHGRVGEIVSDISKNIVEKEKLAGSVADKVVTVSGAMKQELESLYEFPSEKVHVVPNGSFAQNLEKDIDPGTIKEEYGFDETDPLVMFLGRMEYQKGPDVLVEAMPHILDYNEDTNFLMVGKGGMKEYVENKIRGLGVSDKVRMTGYVSEEEKVDLLNASDVVCIPSRNEPFGLVLFEAWAAGNAVVASNVGGLGENIDNFVDGIKTRPNPQPLAWGNNFALDDPNLIRRLGRRGKKKLREFRWDRIARRLVLIYEEAL